MQFKIEKNILQEILTKLSPFLEKKEKNVTSNYFFKLENGILTMAATDYNFSLKLELTSIYDYLDGEFLVSGNDLLSIVKRLKSGEVQLILKGDELSIKQGRSTLKLQTISTDDYPNIEVKDDTMTLVSIKNNVLYDAIKKTLFSVAVGNPKFELNSMLFDFNSTLKIVSTDTRCLSIYDTKSEFSNESQILVPRSAVVEMQKLILNDCEILFNDTFLKVKCKDMIFTTKLVNGKFPDFNRVVPTEHKHIFEIPKDEFMDSVKLITALEDVVKITFDNNSILLESGEGKSINSTEIQLVQNLSEPVSIKFSAAQLLNGLSAIDKDVFKIGINANNLPFSVIVDSLHIVNMPYIDVQKGE